MARLLVVGSVNADMSIRVPKLPEPGETVKGLSMQVSPGGKGANQAVAAILAGAEVSFIGAIGRDALGQQISQSLTKNGLSCNHLVECDESTGTAWIVVDSSSENTIILSDGANSVLSASHVSNQRELIEHADIVLLQNEIPWETTLYTAQLAKHLGVRVCFNPAPVPEPETFKEIVPFIDLLILNETEASYLSGISLSNTEQAPVVAEKLMTMGVPEIIITLGASGCFWSARSGSAYTPSFKVAAVDTTGAGDTFIGAFCTQVADNSPVHDAILFASAASAISVTRYGAQESMSGKDEIVQFIKSHSQHF